MEKKATPRGTYTWVRGHYVCSDAVGYGKSGRYLGAGYGMPGGLCSASTPREFGFYRHNLIKRPNVRIHFSVMKILVKKNRRMSSKVPAEIMIWGQSRS